MRRQRLSIVARVASPVQARTLLNAAHSQQRTGGRLVAFFGCLSFAASRPEEAVALHKLPPTTLAEWAGHTVEVLLGTYAACLDGSGAAVRQRVQEALGHARPGPVR